MTGGQKKRSLDGVSPQTPALSGQVITKDDVIVAWDSLSFERKSRDYRWYLAALLVVLFAIGYSIWTQDYFFAVIVVIVSAVSFWYLKTVKPQKIHFEITPMGINAGTHFYPFSEMHSFWLVYNENVKNLYIAFTKKYLPSLVIGISNIDPVNLKAILLTRMPEQEKRGETMVDKIARVLGLV
jgi:hypothetical protein